MTIVQQPDIKRASTEELEPGQVVERDRYNDKRAVAYRVTQALYRVFGITVGLVGMRLVLRSFGVNPNTEFAALLYNITEPLVRPFAAVLRTAQIEGAAFEPHSLVAIVVYALIGWSLGRLVWPLVGQRHVRSTTS